jgi:hypothetical protein
MGVDRALPFGHRDAVPEVLLLDPARQGDPPTVAPTDHPEH